MVEDKSYSLDNVYLFTKAIKIRVINQNILV